MVLNSKSQAQSQTMRTAIENLQTAMKDYKSLMTESTQERIDTAIKFGVVLAEARLLLPLISHLTLYRWVRLQSWDLDSQKSHLM